MKRFRGFTLIEMMITVVVLAILLTIAVPSFRAFILNNRLTTQANEFITALQLARSEAIKRGAVPVRMTVSVTPAVADNEWGGGWIIWPDTDDDGVQDPGEDTIRTVEALAGGNKLDSIGGVTVFTYNGDGSISNADTLQLTDDRTSGGGCEADKRPGRQIDIQTSGRVVVSAEKCL